MSRKRPHIDTCPAPTPPSTYASPDPGFDADAARSPKRLKHPPSPPFAISHWLNDSDDSPMAAAPSSASVSFNPPPLSTTSSVGRRSSESPSKASSRRCDTTSLRAYRHLTQRAGIVVEERHVPPQVQEHIAAIIDAEPPIDAARLAMLADQLCDSAWDMENAVEKPWVQATAEILRGLRSSLEPAAAIKLVMEDEWRSAPLPNVAVKLNLPSVIPQKRSVGRSRVPSVPQQTDLPPPPTPSQAEPQVEPQVTAAQPEAQALTAQPEPPVPPPPPTERLKTPRPDIHVEFAPSAFASPLPDFLTQLQDSNLLASDPCGQVDMGRFPFLVCELKSSATGSNLYAAHNQAAVGAAAAINMVRNLRQLSVPDASESSPADKTPIVVFSLVNESPTFQLWAHFWDGQREKYVGTCLGEWRVTDRAKALQFTERLAAILYWATAKLRPALAAAVTAVECRFQAEAVE